MTHAYPCRLFERRNAVASPARTGRPALPLHRPSYGGEVHFHFGKEQADPLPRFPDHVSGTYVVATLASGWSCGRGPASVGIPPGAEIRDKPLELLLSRLAIKCGDVVSYPVWAYKKNDARARAAAHWG